MLGKTIKQQFTLIELLIVVCIISILMSMLLPALRASKVKAQSVLCVGNLKQSGIALTSYGSDWDGWAPLTYSATQGTWSKQLFDQSYMVGRDAFVCPSAPPYKFNVAIGNAGFSNTYGMWAYENNCQIRLWGSYIPPGGIPYTAGSTAGSAVVAGGTRSSALYSVLADSASKLTDNTQVYYVYGWVNSMRFFDLRHNSRCNIFFADGHCDSVERPTMTNLRIKYCAMDGVLFTNY